MGRRASPLEDVAIVKAIRERVGASVQIRADANRKWTFQQAVDFANGVRACGLQYLEVTTILMLLHPMLNILE